MAKQSKQQTPREPAKATEAGSQGHTTTSSQPNNFPLTAFRTQAIILAFLALLFYGNTFKNEYAFDDMMAIVSNDYVQRGVAGIGDIMTKDAYQSYLEHKNGGNQLAGGRYRPLSLVTFAIEQQLLGVSTNDESPGVTHNRTKEEEDKMISDMHFRHVVNVLLYALTVVVLLSFLRKVVFKDNPMIAFVAALLFTVHPIHTEVVANVKSRDEILSVLFISLTFLQAFKYKETARKKDLVLGLLCFFLALLSKEYAATLVVLLPLSFYLFNKETIAQSFKSFVPYAIPFVLYVLLRLSSVNGMADGAEKDIMNNPYLYATGAQKIATEFLVLLDYLKLLFFPHPLTADYSFNQIPYTDFGNPMVWLSVVLYAGMAVAMVVLFRQRHLLAFALALYLANLALISNIFFNIGAPMGERLVFHSSIGFAIVVAYFLYKAFDRIKPAATAQAALGGLLVVVVAASGFKTFDRNKAWTNNNTLFLTDVQTSPNSVLANTNAGSACMSYAKTNKDDTTASREWFTKAIGYFSKAITINPGHMLAYENRGLCYFNMRMPEKALPDWDTVKVHAPSLPNIDNYLGIAGKFFFGQGMQHMQQHDAEAAIVSFKNAASAAPAVPDIWYNLALACNEAHHAPEAIQALNKTLQLSPGNTAARDLLAALGGTGK